MAEQQVIRPRVPKSYTVPTDPLFHTQWNVVSFVTACSTVDVLEFPLF